MHTSRILNGRSDERKILEFFQQFSPFIEDPSLRNIVTGVVTVDEKLVNVKAVDNKMV